MNSAKPWIKALEVSDSTYKKWTAEAPKAESFTFWCLKTEKISDHNYLAWAREYYGLPSLNSEFFENSPNLKFWSSIKTVANWSEKMIPILEWDGVVFIACVEPMNDVNWSFPVCYVLADSKNLHSYWQNLQFEITSPQNNTQAAQEATPASVTTNSAVNIPPIPMPIIIDDKSFVGIPPIPELQLLDNFDIKNEAQEKPAEAESKNIEQPDGLILAMPNWNADDVATINKSTSNVLKFDSIKIEKLQNENPAHLDTNEDIEPINNSMQFSGFLHNVSNNFSCAMVLKVERDFVKAHAWDKGFKVVEARATGFWSLNPASAFRVASRSKMPYLGHVVETPANKDFFTAWGFKSLPNSILLQPIISNGKVEYMILAISETVKKNFELMNLGEKLAENFMTLFPNLNKSA